MGNCLKTQLKGSVDNDNLELFGFNTIHVTVHSNMNFSNDFFRIKGNNYVTLVQSGQTNKVIRCLTEDVTMTAVVSGEEILIKVNQMPSSRVLAFAINKYKTTNINFQGYYNTYDVAEIIKFYSPCMIYFGSNNFINRNLNNFENAKISGFYFTNNCLIGNIAALTNLSQLRIITIRDSSAVNGDLSALRNLPNLSTVSLVNTGVTDNEDTVTYLRNRGVNVTFSGNA